MQKIMIMTFYDVIEYFASIKENLEKYEYIVSYYSLFRHAYDQYDKKKDYANHLIEHVKATKPNIILWVFSDIPSDVFIKLKKQFNDITFIFYNFDEPMNVSPELYKKAQTCDIVMTTSKEYTAEYNKFSKVKLENIIYNPFGCDEKYYFPIENNTVNDFTCDIGMVCYNVLYDTTFFNAQTINRKQLITDIIGYCKKKNFVFKLFGSYTLKEFFPENYCGDISYINKNKLYNSAKMIISTQSFSNKSYYINEDIFSIMSSGGLLLTDKSKDIENVLTHKEDVIFLDKNHYIRQIDTILHNYDKYVNIRKNAIETSKKYTWKEWVEKLHVLIVKNKFNDKLYADLYNLNENDATYENWLRNGLETNQIAMLFDIPKDFNATEYAKKYIIEGRSKEYLYFHWYYNDKSDIFFGSGNATNSLFDPLKFNITMEKFLELGTYFDKIKYNVMENLENINKISDNHPNCDINKLLENYINITA